jgi:uncharacterized RmlC-like cupin family protein
VVVVARPDDWDREPGNAAGMERAVAISRDTTGSRNLYSAVVTTPPGGATRIHHHGECETAIYVVEGRARFTWGPTGVENEAVTDVGDIVYVPAHEVHTEQNASTTEPLVVVVTRNCATSVVHYVD